MNAIVQKTVNMLKKMGYFVLQYVYIIYYWKLKLLKTQLQKVKKSGIRKDLNKAYSALGAEVYSLYKQGVTSELRQIPAVEQQLKCVEEAESRIFQVDENINEIQNDFALKKEDTERVYSEKRAAIGACAPEDETGHTMS